PAADLRRQGSLSHPHNHTPTPTPGSESPQVSSVGPSLTLADAPDQLPWMRVWYIS
ncbi:unnamed protein product, partial [Gulo gulo]